MAEPYQFRCPTCEELISAQDQFANSRVKCEQCKAEIVVPNRSRAVKLEEVNPEYSRPFSEEERNKVLAIDPAFAPVLDAATNRNCWEFALTSMLMARRIEVLHQSLSGEHSTGIFPANARFFYSICRDIFAVLDPMYELLTVKLNLALYEDSVINIIAFGEELGSYVDQLHTLHAKAAKQRYSKKNARVKTVLDEWFYHIWENLNNLTLQLQMRGVQQSPVLEYREIQFSLVPPQIHEYFILSEQA